jgi:formyltetrahydrofolate deformylase
MNSITFLIQCPDQKGLVAGISTFFYQRGFNILHCQQYTETETSQYYMRIKLDMNALSTSRRELERQFEEFGREFSLRWEVHYSDHVQKVALLVSKASHCLYDLLLRKQEGEINCEIPLIISNHPDLEMVTAPWPSHRPGCPGKVYAGTLKIDHR